MIHMRNVPREDFNNQLIRKTALPLVTRLSSSEVQWITRRNVDFLLQKRSNIFSNEMRVFCKYNDTLYVKMARLDIMVRLSNVNNVDALSELKEYIIQLDWGFYRLRSYHLDWASEVDVDFVRRNIKAIG